MYNAANRKDIRRAEKAAKLADTNRVAFLRQCLSTSPGRQWFWELLEFCHLFNDPFTGVALTEAYSKGERNVGLRIFADIVTHCPNEYLAMVREADGRREQYNAASEQSRSEDADGGIEGPSSGDDDIFRDIPFIGVED